MTNEYDAILENISVQNHFSGNLIIWGNVSEDTKGRFKDNDWIHTSAIKTMEGGIIQTRNTRYKIKSFGGEIGEWIKENEIDIETEEGQLAVKLRWF